MLHIFKPINQNDFTYTNIMNNKIALQPLI